MLTDRQILEVRSHFPLLSEKTWLYNCSQGALSDRVDGAMKDYAQSWRTSMDPWRDWVGAYEALRAGFARFIGAKPDEIAVVTRELGSLEENGAGGRKGGMGSVVVGQRPVSHSLRVGRPFRFNPATSSPHGHEVNSPEGGVMRPAAAIPVAAIVIRDFSRMTPSLCLDSPTPRVRAHVE